MRRTVEIASGWVGGISDESGPTGGTLLAAASSFHLSKSPPTEICRFCHLFMFFTPRFLIRDCGLLFVEI